jgi:hypothetical protein
VEDLPGLIEEKRLLTLDSPASRQRGKNVSLINKQSKPASLQTGDTKSFALLQFLLQV